MRFQGRDAAYWEQPNEFGWSVAHYAAGKGHLRLLRQLRAFGVDLWRPGAGGRTPAHWAATNGHQNCLAYLLGLPGADVNAANNSGWALVHCAACQNHVGCMQLLLDRGADPEATNNKGETARGATKSHRVRALIDRFTKSAPQEGKRQGPGEIADSQDNSASGDSRLTTDARKLVMTYATAARSRPVVEILPEDLAAIRAKRRQERALRKERHRRTEEAPKGEARKKS